jgi:hypothetical protein
MKTMTIRYEEDGVLYEETLVGVSRVEVTQSDLLKEAMKESLSSAGLLDTKAGGVIDTLVDEKMV